jgi:hypothetical protein
MFDNKYRFFLIDLFDYTVGMMEYWKSCHCHEFVVGLNVFYSGLLFSTPLACMVLLRNPGGENASIETKAVRINDSEIDCFIYNFFS